MKKLSKNFDYWEFRPHRATKDWAPNSRYQKELLLNLVTNLQVVRSAMPKGAYMLITSGVRTMSDFIRLKDAGYNPSTTSDHFFGVPIPISENSRKYKTFGGMYSFSVGAADCVPIGMPADKFFNLAVDLTRNGECDFGQIILERNSSGTKEWIHFGGCANNFFSPIVTSMLNKSKYLMSANNGKTYVVV